MDYRAPWMRSVRLNLPTDTERFRRSRRIPEPRDGFISTRDKRQAKYHCQRQTRLGRSLRIPKHRDRCSTVNRVRSSWPSLTRRVRLGRFWLIPERRDGCYVQTVQTTDLPNSSRVLFNQHSQANTTSRRVESKAAGVTFQLRSGGTSGYGRDTTTHYAQSASSLEKRLESQSPQPNEVYELSTQSSSWRAPRRFARLESHRKEHRLVSQCSFHQIRCFKQPVRSAGLQVCFKRAP